MLAQFGTWNFEGTPPSQGYIEKVRAILSFYGQDGEGRYSGPALELLCYAFHTTRESRSEIEPHTGGPGTVLAWDGRLDNRQDLLRELGEPVLADSPDVQVVAKAYERWGDDCFRRLLGDWALSLCDPSRRFVMFAKDPIGTRPLYYLIESDRVTWSSVLDPLVLLAPRKLTLDEEYVAGWLSHFPATHLTPYVEIHSVPPASCVRVELARHSIVKYWDFDPETRIRYATDREYEEQFRWLFRQAVRRRLRADRPVLAELSGGMDSSSIVCVGDDLLRTAEAEAPRLDTISYYDDSEPNSNERPFFTEIEQRRGRVGCHIDLTARRSPRFRWSSETFLPTPRSNSGYSHEFNAQFQECISRGTNRVVLSGTGGDEVAGGVPTPTPELQDLIATAAFWKAARRLKTWALAKRKPWLELLNEALAGFFADWIAANRRPAPWIEPAFIRRNRLAFQGYQSRIDLFGALPSFQTNLHALEGLRRQLSVTSIGSAPLFEKRYPFLDSNLLEFLFAIPRDQLVRPGERRSLLRRALRGVVPDRILDRKRKAYATRAPLAAIVREWPALLEITRSMVSADAGWVDERHFSEFLERAKQGRAVPLVPLMRTLHLELWLKHLIEKKVYVPTEPAPRTWLLDGAPIPVSAEKN